MQLNSVLNLSDMGSFHHRKEWEVNKALETLKHFGVTAERKRILGVGAGHEPTIFLLLASGAEVIATDLYNDAGMWADTADAEMLTAPEKFVPEGLIVDLSRLTVQHADMCELPFEDNSFDGVFSSGSIEHVGSFENVARAAREIGRVLKPGGICSLSTEWKIAGAGFGWDGVLLFDEVSLNRYLIEPSGLLPVDAPYLTVHPETFVNAAVLEDIVRTRQMPDLETALVSATWGYTFTSIHLALRKPFVGIEPEQPSAEAATVVSSVEAATGDVNQTASVSTPTKLKVRSRSK